MSEPGRGTIFKIYWPAASEVPGEEAPPKPEAPARGGTETILIVDDEADIRDLTTEALETSGYTVVQAASGEEALTIYLARDEAIDLVIMDLNMPGMGGRQCLLELIHLDSEARVLVASGYSADGPAGEILGLGAAGFIGKPYRISELLASIRDILDR
ncbi:MAG: response regulator [Deltaproteobacteria bacterium]|nr:response regulator [Deltaproteobacteria bacterium]